VKPGTFDFSQATLIKADNPKGRPVALLKDFLTDQLHLHNRISKYKTRVRSLRGTVVYLTEKGSEKLPKEGYKLTITPHRIYIIGKDAGLFYGIQTLIQLFPIEHSVSEKITLRSYYGRTKIWIQGDDA